MQKVAKFHKVSEQEFLTDWCSATGSSVSEAKAVYQKIRLPRRATVGSAG